MPVIVLEGVITHSKDCTTCDGLGWVTLGNSNAPNAHAVACEDCEGTGEDLDDGCDCQDCCDKAEEMEAEDRFQAKERALADYECQEMEEDR